MHKLFDESQPELTANQYNHTDETGNYRIQLHTDAAGERSLEVERYNQVTTLYDVVSLSATQTANWLDLIDLVESTGTNHLPTAAHPNYAKSLKVLRANEVTAETLKARIAELEAENAKLRQE